MECENTLDKRGMGEGIEGGFEVWRRGNRW